METAPTPPLSLWRAEFTDAATEQAYRADVQGRMARQLRIALWVWAALLLLFALPDYQALGGSRVFWALLGYRAATALLLLMAAQALRTRPHLAPQGRMVMCLEMAGYPFFFLFLLLRPEMRTWTIGMVMIVNLSLFIFVPGRVALGVWVALAGIAGSVLTLLLTGTALSLAPGLTLLLTLPAVVGFISANRLQRAQRQEFVVRSRLQQANAALQDEIARRTALQAELQRQATTDPLTGLLNRREFGRRFALDLARAERDASPLSVVLLDLDHFKKINDQFGHAAGDEVLRQVARLCQESFRAIDSVGRMGGEEIAVLLPGATLEQAAVVALRFAQRLAATPVVHGGHTIHLSATLGVAQRLPDENVLDAVLHRADQALYAGKHGGRNCVMRAQPDGQFLRHAPEGG
ncbi:GGDEF domain-containing protein [Diaphorobacter sp.]|uniref:GGDEF domain-containing protein n=1 Tax=Diaphorobacter sp. TaxID=1934310 RepID=UPI0025871A47|nr:GGDEF domain-containing protein [Diaphorobacter sp.]